MVASFIVGLGFVCSNGRRCQDSGHLEGSGMAGKTGQCSRVLSLGVLVLVDLCLSRGSVNGSALKGRKRQLLGLLKAICSGKK